MSDPEPREQPVRPTDGKGDIPWRLIVFAALAVYAVLIVLLNRKQVDVSFVFFSAEISLLVLIVLCVGLGFVGGYLFDELRDRRKQSR